MQRSHTIRIWAVPLAIASTFLLLDQATKWWVVQTLGPETMARSITLPGGWIRLVYSHNTGVAFSMFQGHPELLTIAALCIVAGAIYFYTAHLDHHQPLIQASMGLIMGGAFGNLIDRIRLGYVVDFISVGWFPIFNVADSAITIGAVLLIYQFLREDLAERRARKHETLTSQ
ncbi:signal peptidase II [Candidatus Chloroploca asiatica]|uniref:signal peptidase II n=1 Tax=Candidatus Chloroploca asiatica TaxID=1506545 RepID=UPI001FEB387B|nr:signal peptidase II [Candidatus Chloroploca asiatica]